MPAGRGTRAEDPSSSSIRSSRLYLATRSEREGAPVLIWPAPVATARSAIVVSSVSPERCEITARVAGLAGDADRLQGLGEGADLVDLDEDRVADAELDAAAQALTGLVTKRSSPTSWTASPRRSVSSFQPSQSSSSMPSSIETIG